MLELTILILYVTLLSLELFIEGILGLVAVASAYTLFTIRNAWRLTQIIRLRKRMEQPVAMDMIDYSHY